MTRLATIFVVVALAVPAGAQETKPTVELRTDLEAPIELAQPAGSRVIVNVPSGGSVRGPKIKGQLVAPGGDWLQVMPDGSARLDVRVTIKTDDDALIFVEYGGIIAWSKEVNDRFGKGEVITAADGYFLTAPRFSTASPNYAWLNNLQAVGKMVTVQKGTKVVYDIFAVR
jgi:uncharacterized protein DUF3237